MKEIMIGSGLFWIVLNSFRALMMGLRHEAHVELLQNLIAEKNFQQYEVARGQWQWRKAVHAHGVSSTIVDIETVCNAGKEITEGFSTADRISHYAADFMTDDLPRGFDVVLECDVCVYEEELFRKLQNCLNPGGRLVIVDQFAPEPGVVPPGRPLAWGFLGSLEDPNFSFATSEEVRETLVRTGYRLRDETELPGHWLMIDASLPGG